MKPIQVVKRDGSKEDLNLEKIQTQITRACDGISDVSPSMIELKARIQFEDGMTSETIDKLLLRAMVDLIDVTADPDIAHTNYQYVAGRQRMRMLRKTVYGSNYPKPLFEMVVENVTRGAYTTELLEWYTKEEWEEIDDFIDHSRDDILPYAAVEQLVEKYLVQNRTNKQVFETPQLRYAVAAATVFHAEDKKGRIKNVKDYYDACSKGQFSLATPILAGTGTPTRQFSSCVLLTAGDSLKSIFSTGEMMADYAAKRAGIGLEIGKIRGIGAPIRNGEIMHTGLIPFLKKWFYDLRSCCLRPDMLVEILDETKFIPISDVKVGMKIKSFDGNKVVFKEVVNSFETIVNTEDQVRLEFENGTVVHCSINHPIMCFTDVDEVIECLPHSLTTEHRIITDAGVTRLLSIDIGQSNDSRYIDLTVENTHTFFTSDTEKTEQILTHNSQGGIRNSSCSVYLPVWHYQFDDFIVLKNNQGTEENRIRHLDYGVVLSKFFWQRLLDGKNITFFDPSDVPDLYDAYYSDVEKFEKLYIKYEKDTTIRKKEAPALVVFRDWILKERTDTGRIYLVFIDNVIQHTPFDVKTHPIVQSNLCAEILLPSVPFDRVDDDKGRIALCTLGSINWGSFRHPTDMRKACSLLVRALSNILSYQDFLSIQSELANKEFEPLGIGVTNLAYWHAKHGYKYGEPEALAEVKRWMEHQAFYLTEASVEIAKERGPCLLSHTTHYGKGSFPWERRVDAVNELTDFTPELDWEPLRQDMLKYGIRNATLMAVAPVESSSVVISSTNGIEMPMDLISIKESKAGSLIQVVPEYNKLKNKYQLMWEQTDCIEYLKTSAVISAYVDQSISTNTFYSPKHFPDGKIDATLVMKNLMLAQRWGIKSMYYSLVEKLGSKTSEDFIGLADQNVILESGTAGNDDDGHCDSCTL